MIEVYTLRSIIVWQLVVKPVSIEIACSASELIIITPVGRALAVAFLVASQPVTVRLGSDKVLTIMHNHSSKAVPVSPLEVVVSPMLILEQVRVFLEALSKTIRDLLDYLEINREQTQVSLAINLLDRQECLASNNNNNSLRLVAFLAAVIRAQGMLRADCLAIRIKTRAPTQ